MEIEKVEIRPYSFNAENCNLLPAYVTLPCQSVNRLQMAVFKNNTALDTSFPRSQITGSPARNTCPEGFLGSCLMSGCLEPTPPPHPPAWAATQDEGPGASPPSGSCSCLAPCLTEKPTAQLPTDSCKRFFNVHKGRERAKERRQNKTNRGKEHPSHVHILKDPICSSYLN